MMQGNDRYLICKQCEKFNDTLKLCTVCHCFMPVKTNLYMAHCPLDKWGPGFIRPSDGSKAENKLS